MKSLLISILYITNLFANSPSVPPEEIKAIKVLEKITIDGILNESTWKNNTPITYFKQRNPNEGSEPSQKSEAFIAFDEENLYIAANLFDASPDSIIARLGRRDQSSDTDLFGFFVDPYLDGRTGYYFGLSAAGTYLDGVLLNDEWDDESWDGVWQGKTQRNEDGWSLEMRIPFSQLRFTASEKMIWGVNFRRDIIRTGEELFLVYTPKNGSGFVSRFVHLTGLTGVKPSNNIQIMPYIRAKSEHLQVEKGDPFNDGARQLYGFGTDFKIGISSNLTLDGTINPDFGQAEVDPAVINLSDNEIFFSEKRPFFIEGSSIFNFGQGGSRSNWGFNWGSPEFFYSRRIGAPTTGNVPDNTFSDIPEATSIISAMKLTGKVGDGWNIGGVVALTNREYAEVEHQSDNIRGKKEEIEVEPLANYSVLRAQKEFNDGEQGIGFITTNTFRDFKKKSLENDLNRSAHVFGIDGWSFLDNDQTYVLTGWAGYSSVHGNKSRITDLQSNFLHRYQRPDFKSASVDSNATALTGFAGRILLNKQKGNWILNSALGFVDPGFDVNDLGFVWQTNKINGHLGGGYKWTDPTEYFRNLQILGSFFGTKDFDGNTTWAGFWYNFSLQTLGYNWFEFGGAFNPETISVNRTRGGPLTKNKAGTEFFFWMQSDRRKSFWVEWDGYTYISQDGSKTYGTELEFKWNPMDNFHLSFEPEAQWDFPDAQWVGSFKDDTDRNTFGKRYVFSKMNYKEFSSTISADWTFNPDLSLQVYIQPLISSGDYYDFKYLSKSNSYDFIEFGDNGTSIDFDQQNNEYTADPDGAGAAESISWDNPDFTSTSLIGNAVLRWEYMPGSTFYLVWTQNRFHNESNGHIRFGKKSYLNRFLGREPDNVFLLKFTYWLGI